LVLHTVGYEDGGRLRPILYRASLAEMVVPYGDPAPTHWRKNAFDEGEYGVGMLANRLQLGCDCLGEIRYLDAVVSDGHGEPVTLENAICMHEEDFGILWKHTNIRTGQVEVRRSRRFVISSIATVGNYEYGFFWYLYQDGTIELQIKLTGIVSTGAIAPGAVPQHSVLLAPGLYAPNHQHWFSFRLDMMVDGTENSVYEVNSEALPIGPANPNGNAWIARRTLPRRAGTRPRPGESAPPSPPPASSVPRRAGFMMKHLWVTRYERTELFAAGDYPNQHPGGAGLPAYVKADRPLEQSDIVLWYSVGSHHISRSEEWPVMPVGYAGFQLKPAGFFVGSPALDVPASSHNGHNGAAPCH